MQLTSLPLFALLGTLASAWSTHTSSCPSEFGKDKCWETEGCGAQQRNDVDRGLCRDITVIFARGSIELGNVGYLTGPPFFDALDRRIGAGRVAVQGVHYPGSITSNADLQLGARPMKAAMQKAVLDCPETKIVLSGYSQGAQVIHTVVPELDGLRSRISSIVLFGDPFNGTAISGVPAGKVKTFCQVDDVVCKQSRFLSPDHFIYAVDAEAGAAFVAANL